MKQRILSDRQLVAYRRRVVNDSCRVGVTKASRMYALHRSTIYEWRKNIVPQKKGPQERVCWQTPSSLERVVVHLRQQTNFGPKRLKYELALHGIILGEKAIRGILERRKLVRKQKKKRKKKSQVYYAPYPGYRIQVDTKSVPDPGVDLRSPLRYQFTAIDICTRIRFLLIYDSLSNSNTLDFIQRAIAFYEQIGITVETVQTDNHTTFTNLYAGGNKKKDHESLRIHPLTHYLLSRGIQHILSRPGTPTDNAFVERSHRTDEEEFYRTLSLASLSLSSLNMKIQSWCHYYNFLRLHSSCNNLPPMKFFLTVGETGA